MLGAIGSVIRTVVSTITGGSSSSSSSSQNSSSTSWVSTPQVPFSFNLNRPNEQSRNQDNLNGGQKKDAPMVQVIKEQEQRKEEVKQKFQAKKDHMIRDLYYLKMRLEQPDPRAQGRETNLLRYQTKMREAESALKTIKLYMRPGELLDPTSRMMANQLGLA